MKSYLCPALPGCNSWGNTQEDAINNIEDAVRIYIKRLFNCVIASERSERGNLLTSTSLRAPWGAAITSAQLTIPRNDRIFCLLLNSLIKELRAEGRSIPVDIEVIDEPVVSIAV